METVAIIVPVYNVEPYLRRCVDSILGQTYPDFALILVDDGSPDHCGAICDEYAARDSRIHVIHQENGGLSAARNAGIDWAFANSDSRWLTFVDSDDWIHPRMLEWLLAGALETGAVLSVCGFVETTGEVPVPEPPVPTLWEPERFYTTQNTNAIIACGKLYEKQLFARIRYPNGMLHEDELTTYKLLFSQTRIAVMDSPLYYYYQNAEGITKSKWSPKRLDALQGLKEQADFFEKNAYHEARDFAAKACIWFICGQKRNIKDSELPHKEKNQYISLLNHELCAILRDYRRVYLKKENVHIFCEILPVLKPIYSLASFLRGAVKGRQE